MEQLNHVSKRNRGWLIVAILAFTAAMMPADRAAFAQCQYEVTAILDIGDCDIGDSHTFGQGMNNNADVVGFYRFCSVGNERAFFWSQETGFITLPHPPGVVRSWAYDISDSRIIVGQHEFTGIGRKGFAYDMTTGEYHHLEPLHDGATAMNVSSAKAINNSGVVAGMRIIGKPGDPTPLPYNAVIWRPLEKDSPVEDLGVMSGPNSEARAINPSDYSAGWTGQIADAIAYRQTNKSLELINQFFDFDVSFSNAILSDGTVVGAGIPKGTQNSVAFLWNGDSITMIPAFPPYTKAGAVDANSIGQVLIGMNPGDVTALWQHDEIHLIDPSARAIALNDFAQILLRTGTSGRLLSPQNVPLADLNFDCKVDAHDLMLLLNAWGPQPLAREARKSQSHRADLNGDGVVDGADLLILLSNWNP